MRTIIHTSAITSIMLLGTVLAGCPVEYTFGGALETIVDPCSGDEIGLFDPRSETFYFDDGTELARYDVDGTLGGPEDLEALARCEVEPRPNDRPGRDVRSSTPLRWEYQATARYATYRCVGVCDGDGCREACTGTLVVDEEACVGSDGDDRGCGCDGSDEPGPDLTCQGGDCVSPVVDKLDIEDACRMCSVCTEFDLDCAASWCPICLGDQL